MDDHFNRKFKGITLLHTMYWVMMNRGKTDRNKTERIGKTKRKFVNKTAWFGKDPVFFERMVFSN